MICRVPFPFGRATCVRVPPPPPLPLHIRVNPLIKQTLFFVFAQKKISKQTFFQPLCFSLLSSSSSFNNNNKNIRVAQLRSPICAEYPFFFHLPPPSPSPDFLPPPPPLPIPIPFPTITHHTRTPHHTTSPSSLHCTHTPHPSGLNQHSQKPVISLCPPPPVHPLRVAALSFTPAISLSPQLTPPPKTKTPTPPYPLRHAFLPPPLPDWGHAGVSDANSEAVDGWGVREEGRGGGRRRG